MIRCVRDEILYPNPPGPGARTSAGETNLDYNLIVPDSLPWLLTQRVYTVKENILVVGVKVILIMLMPKWCCVMPTSMMLMLTSMSLSQPSGAGGEGRDQHRER